MSLVRRMHPRGERSPPQPPRGPTHAGRPSRSVRATATPAAHLSPHRGGLVP